MLENEEYKEEVKTNILENNRSFSQDNPNK